MKSSTCAAAPRRGVGGQSPGYPKQDIIIVLLIMVIIILTIVIINLIIILMVIVVIVISTRGLSSPIS